jgi:predicted RND superfamily exporter protein
MGKLMALSLLTTLVAAVVFQPALMATQRKCAVPKQSSTPGMK